MPDKFSQVGFVGMGIGIAQLLGFLSVASPVSGYLVWIIAMISIFILAMGVLNVIGLSNKHAYLLSRDNLFFGMLPAIVLLFIFLMLVSAGVFLGVR
ncbi:hypothetical protein PCC6912_40020 [Chlorogloeopsis fritschii PCC 6912]|uniref:Uncharacterized protein n=1 Tax=Chlorogloeopsis fritschii PCC 6912 TaxID=211165 RepID=A0A3S1FFC6_CHLFR|nr:hypothetical protein [Chlorogloeopsis fritschii]RUR77043.1 hypothetical protein PCC6912_40020 [Chlorogloeopsis fritschii PCC 6912]